MNAIINFKDLTWSSDFNGNELGYDEIPVVGLYTWKTDFSVSFYINMETNEILEILCDNSACE